MRVITLDRGWLLVDVMNESMAISSLIALALLSSVIFRPSRDYLYK